MSLYPGVASPVKAPKALYDGLKAVLTFLSGEKRRLQDGSTRMGICTVFEFKEKEGDRIWRSLFVKPN